MGVKLKKAYIAKDISKGKLKVLLPYNGSIITGEIF